MGTGVFENCTGLESFSLSQSITEFEDRTFFGCSSLTSITIHSNITYIGNSAFDGCTGLTDVTCLAILPPELGTNVFYNVDCPNIPLMVPVGSYNAYKAADQWKEFKLVARIEDAVENVSSNNSAYTTKTIRNGQVLILRGNHTYTLTGQQIK